MVVEPNYQPGSQWVASILVGELQAGDGFFTPEQGSQIVVKCILGRFYGNNPVESEIKVNRQTTIDGQDAWLVESHLTFDIEGLETKGETLIVAIVTAPNSSGLYYASIPDTTPELLPAARAALERSQGGRLATGKAPPILELQHPDGAGRHQLAQRRVLASLIDQSAGRGLGNPRVTDDGHVTAGVDKPQQPVPGRQIVHGLSRKIVGDDHTAELQIAANHGPQDFRREGCPPVGIDFSVGRGGDHHHVGPCVHPASKTGKHPIAPPGHAVDDVALIVGVAFHEAKAREVLDRRRDVCLVHARDECAHFGSDPLRIRAIAATELCDRLISAARGLRHDIGDGRQVGIDAGSLELAPPSVRFGGQGAIVVCGLVRGSRNRVESSALQPLNQAAFLIDRQQRLGAFRGPGGPTSSSSDVSNRCQ